MDFYIYSIHMHSQQSIDGKNEDNFSHTLTYLVAHSSSIQTFYLKKYYNHRGE